MTRDDITVFVSVFNRPSYTEESLRSLAENWQGWVVLVDDGSDDETKSIIEEVSRDHWRIITNEQNEHIEQVVQIVSNLKNRYVYITDNDVIYSSDFQEKLLALGSLAEKEYRAFVLTLFNSPNHHQISMFRQPRTYKQVPSGMEAVSSCGGISMLTRPRLVGAWMKNDIATDLSWDYRFCFFCQLARVPIVRSQESYVQHIGEYGVNSLGRDERFDQAINFIA